MPKNSLSITDNRTGADYEVSVSDGTIRAIDLRQIRASEDDFGLMSYDPGFTNTASCRSKITFIDGDEGILRYRGYPIEQLAEECNYLQTAYLILFGELPGEDEYETWSSDIRHHTLVHKGLEQLISSFPYDGYSMGMLMSAIAALSAFYPESKNLKEERVRRIQIERLIAKVPTIAALIYRHKRGFYFVHPDNDLSYTGNFLNMMFKIGELKYEPNPILERALDVLFILHADHEQNCSTNVMRSAGSSRPDPYCTAAGAVGALAGPLHGGANEAVLRMLREIGAKDQVPNYVERAKAGEFRLMGFGHRVYKNYDPRAKIIKRMADQVFEVTGSNPLLDIALEMERIALQDDYFVERKLYPNVDFYSGLIYQAMEFPSSMFPVLFALARTSGWLAQWQEMLLDPEQKIARPRQIYEGPARREVKPAYSASLSK
ncbi:MAG: citrate synthase [Acidobacteriota bacterium]